MNRRRESDQPDLFADPPAEAEAPSPTSLRGKLFSIASHVKFLTTLADRILDGTLLGDWPREGPFWLADVTIVLPTRRARLALARAFLDRGHGLLPDIRTFGGDREDEEPFLPPHDLPELPPAVSGTERRLVLGRLIEAWAHTPAGAAVLATPPNAAEIIGLADSLGELIDDLASEEVPYARLRQLPPDNLNAHWQKILAFLDIAFMAWPQRLEIDGRMDAVALRNARLRRQAEAAGLVFGDRPVIAAGSTGSIRATAELLGAIARLPRGALVLPGLDTTLTPKQHQALVEGADTHGHPQYGLGKLLRSLGAGPAEVIELATPMVPRTAVIRAALAPARETATWAETRALHADAIAAAAEGLSLIAARTADEEARAIALATRDAVARGKTVGIVSPDQTLSRRIAAELTRFGIVVDDPAGTPLFQSAAGRLVRLGLALQQSAYGPVELIALLRNKATTLGLERSVVNRLAGRLELCLLRGQRLRPGIAGLREALARNGVEGQRGPRLTPDEKEAIAALFDRLEGVIGPLGTDWQKSTAFAQTIVQLFAALTAEGDTPVPGAEDLAVWAADLAAHPGEGPTLPAGRNMDNVLYALMRGYTVRLSPERRRDDVAIWGLLEARLQSPDLMILAGLNEDVWPPVVDSGPWLSRGMRMEIGLEPPERRQGQAAHDFEMAIGNEETILACASRLGTAPALPSRLLQRLTAFLGDALTQQMTARGDRWRQQALAVDTAPTLTRSPRPEPKPPAAARPRQLSVTEVETLFRSPYDLYAKHVLKLRKLAPLGEAPDARDRGTIVHDIFASFVSDHDIHAPDALEQLQAIAKERFSGLDVIAERRDIWLRRFTDAARQFLDFERGRDIRVAARHAEVDAHWAFPSGFTLTGRADRVDYLTDGTAEILDFKTGGIPQPADMTKYLAPQLPLEAAMLAAGAFPALRPVAASALTYVKVSLGPEAFNLVPFRLDDGVDVPLAADGMAQRLQHHVDRLLLSDDLPMAPYVLPRSEGRQRFVGDYDHLMRADEWRVNEGDESE